MTPMTTFQTIAIFISGVILVSIIINVILVYHHNQKTTKHLIRIKRDDKAPQSPTLHEIMDAEWPGDYQEAEIYFQNDEKEELLVRSDDTGLFLYRTEDQKEFRNLQDFKDANIIETVITMTYMIYTDHWDKTNDS